MLFLSPFFFLSVEEEEEDGELAEVKPGMESEQQEDDDSRETKEGTKEGSLCSSLSSSPDSFHAVGQTRTLVCDTTSRLQPYQMEGGGESWRVHHISHQACRGRR